MGGFPEVPELMCGKLRLIPDGRLWALSSYPLASPISSKCPKQKDPQGSTG